MAPVVPQVPSTVVQTPIRVAEPEVSCVIAYQRADTHARVCDIVSAFAPHHSNAVFSHTLAAPGAGGPGSNACNPENSEAAVNDCHQDTLYSRWSEMNECTEFAIIA